MRGIFRNCSANSTEPHIHRIVFEACSEVLDRGAELEALVRGSENWFFLSDEEAGNQKSPNRSEVFLKERKRLLKYQAEVRSLELSLDAAIWKLTIFGRLEPMNFFGADGFFVRKIDQAISDHSDVNNPNSSEGVQVLSSNYLIMEEKFPYGELFSEKDVKIFFQDLRESIRIFVESFRVQK